MSKKIPYEIEVIEARTVVFSGHPSSARVTIPPKIVKRLKIKKGDQLAFIAGDKFVIVENVRRMLPEILKQESLLFVLNIIGQITEKSKELDMLEKRYVKGEVGEADWRSEYEKLMKEMKELMKILNEIKEKVPSKFFSERELHFVSSNEIDQLLAAIAIDEEQEKEMNFLALISEVETLKAEVDDLRDTLSKLENSISEGKISKGQYTMLKEKYLGKLTLAEDRLKRLKKLVCSL
ncbi:MAG: AbrB/MazE/SpoVT family DNA-binding domain-containing protein [Candidatus Aenigmatarchaeota archaeon]